MNPTENIASGLAQDASKAVEPSSITVRFNAKHNGVEMVFPGKPERSVIDRCKAAGFRWLPRTNIWYKKFGTYAWAQAHTIAGIEQAPQPTIHTPDRFDMDAENRMAEQCGL